MKNATIVTPLVFLSKNELTGEETLLIDKAKEASQHAYAPYSRFQVGAAVLLDNGEVVTGNNQENVAYPSGICAERTVVFYANAQQPDVPVRAIAIAAQTGGEWIENPISPCGSCRQVLLETENRFGKPIQVFLYGSRQIIRLNSVKDLLPLAFQLSESI